MRIYGIIRPILAATMLLSAANLFGNDQSFAQNSSTNAVIPNFWDPKIVESKPEELRIKRLRFLTTTDFPPFNFIDRNKRLSGFHIDLAREVCRELKILPLCQIQALPWNELDKAMEIGDGEAIIGGLNITSASKEKFDFSDIFLQIPGRFVALASSNFREPMRDSLRGKTVGVVKGSSHARYFRAAFPEILVSEYDTLALAKEALMKKFVDVLFSDAVSVVFWLPSKSANNCCHMVGEAYISQEYFGNGLAIAFVKGHPDLVAAVNYALRKIYTKGIYRELYLRYFPISLY